jgi:hypothetical protein
VGKTGEQIFKLASALIYEDVNADAESRAFTVQFLNIRLQECLAIENAIRRSKNMAQLTEAPWLTTLDETIDYQDALTRVALPYACVSHYYAEAMNEERSMYFDNEYKRAQEKATVAVEEDITDAYAAEA